MTGIFSKNTTSLANRPGSVHAILGPTNTGKTHYALSRMIAHESGIIGFPLRLLARENYERLVKLKGKESVALLTGEEKIVPKKARWFSCTVEAMPLEHKVDFIAIDEIQLAADPDRGHIFTDRLLHTRGKGETLFLGSETIRNLLRQIIPGIEIKTRPRLSQLANRGPTNLTRLPPRSAIVAFSATEIYALAEAIHQKRGGCAIIMGRLSPRTRNAQIALYQNRDVDYLVATDAIGMGLNMDVDHVALAALHKFDGQTPRDLTAQEIAQITGRAGRGMKDGTFGTTASCPPMSQEIISAIEDHRLEPVRQIYWRQTQLDYSNPNTLLHSLMCKPPRPELVMGRTASDVEVLQGLIRMPDIMDKAKGHRATSLLWDLCQIPDFQKLSDDSHIRLCARLFLEMMQHGHISPGWIEGQLRSLDRIEGDIDTLMHRLSAIRVCAYISARSGWIHNSRDWQKRSQKVEEHLSDALHERLTARFVNRRATVLLRRKTGEDTTRMLYAVTAEDRIIIEGHEIGQITGFNLQADITENDTESILLRRTGQRALRAAMPQRIQQFLKEAETSLHLDPEGIVTWRKAPIASLVKDRGFFTPNIHLLPGEFHDIQQSRRVEGSIRHYVTRTITQQLKCFFEVHAALEAQGRFRGLSHRLYEDGGTTPTLPQDQKLSQKERALLRKHGIIIGPRYSFVLPLLKPASIPMMTLLARIWHDKALTPPPAGRFSLPLEQGTGLPGWIQAGPVMLRVDCAERILNFLLSRQKTHMRTVPHNLASLFGVKKTMLPAILRSLGIAHRPAQSLSATYYGPAAPLMLMPHEPLKKASKNKKTKEKHSRANPDSPFAALTKWKKS